MSNIIEKEVTRQEFDCTAFSAQNEYMKVSKEDLACAVLWAASVIWESERETISN